MTKTTTKKTRIYALVSARELFLLALSALMLIAAQHDFNSSVSTPTNLAITPASPVFPMPATAVVDDNKTPMAAVKVDSTTTAKTDYVGTSPPLLAPALVTPGTATN